MNNFFKALTTVTLLAASSAFANMPVATNVCANPAAYKVVKLKISNSFNQFTGTNVEVLEQFYAPNVKYSDPISTVTGLDNVKKLLAKTYRNVQSLRYAFFDFICESNRISASYKLNIQISGLNDGKPYIVEGTSVFRVNSEGMVVQHKDYFDLGSMVYEKHPLTGGTIRAIKAGLAKHD